MIPVPNWFYRLAPVLILVFAAESQTVSAQSYPLNGTVRNDKGDPIEGAVVLLQQQITNGLKKDLVGKQEITDASGKYSFERVIPKGANVEFLVTVLAKSHVMESKVKKNRNGKKVSAINFRLKPAIEKQFSYTKGNGEPIEGVGFYPSRRIDERGKEHIISPVNRIRAQAKTDDQGLVDLSYFNAGDKVQLLLVKGSTARSVFELVVDTTPIQSVTGDSSAEALTGELTDELGRPVVSAMVLLVHERWKDETTTRAEYMVKTDKNGVFEFPGQYRLESKSHFRLTAVANNRALASQKIENDEGKKLEPIQWALKTAIEKKFVLQTESGEPLGRVSVHPVARKSKEGKVHLVDPLCAQQQLRRRTSSKGEVEFKYFAAGDQVRLVLPRKDNSLNIDFVVDDQPVQTVVVKAK